jgi:aminopeptidase
VKQNTDTIHIHDLQIDKLADILLDHSLEVREGHRVLISSPSDAKPLALAVYKACLLRGAHPWQRITFPESEAIFYENANGKQIDYISPIDMSMLDLSDRILFIRTETNTKLLANTDSALISRRRKAIGPAHKLMRDKRWCATFFPSQALADRAGLTLSEFSSIFFDAVNQDWSEIENVGKSIASILDKSKQIKLEGEGTDLTFSISGRTSVVGCGRFNLPDGEVYTAPVEDTTNGKVKFDLPVDFDGHTISGAELTFSNGEVIDFRAKRGGKALACLLQVDDGARRLGEFAIGTNYALTTPLGHIALDEKLGGTFHLAIGFTPPDTGGTNQSAVHFDLLKDIRHHGRIVADGITIVENGKLQVT